MSPLSPGRISFAVALSLFFLLVLLRLEYGDNANTIFPTKATSIDIANETLGFEKIFVVNAPWRTDRKDAMSLAASYSRFKMEWIKGIDAETIQQKAFPPGSHRKLSPGNLGSWRAHMNAMREIVVRNLSTALILEDDVDWDIRVRFQLHSFNQAARRLPHLPEGAKQELRGLPPAFEGIRQSPRELAERSSVPLGSRDISTPMLDPFAHWDVLWLGHCGAALPAPSVIHPNRLMLLNDPTVPDTEHIRLRGSAPQDEIAKLYPSNTRVYHRTSNSTLCTLAYAVTQRGARKILYELGIRQLSQGFDFALSDFCAGSTGRSEMTLVSEEDVHRRLDCLTVQPPIFSHYWGEKGNSDIQGTGVGGRPDVGSRYVIRSVRGNLDGLIQGGEVFEQWGAKTPDNV